jgi:hypothetical protein
VSQPFLAPEPGDPRSSGPRPRPGGRDLAWGALAVAVVVVTVLQLARLAYLAATDPDVAITGGLLVLAVVITVVWLLTVFWVAVGAWRRTVWGCPFDHTADAPRLRRCPRHPTVEVASDAGAGPREGPPPGRTGA